MSAKAVHRKLSVTIQGKTSEVVGLDPLIDSTVDDLEKQYVGHRLKEEAYAALCPMAPDDLQRKAFTKEDFMDVDVNPNTIGHVLRILGRLGAHTYADVLSLGADALVAQSRHPLGKGLGPIMLSSLKIAIFRQTGHVLPAKRASSAEQYKYFSNIMYASPALGLPTADILNYHAGLWQPVRELGFEQPTIGDLHSLPFPFLQNALGITKATSLNSFIRELDRTVVEPFFAASQEDEPVHHE